jgi:2,4-dienoyl-CoA reductase-like NADH-dependent reductase (Old Yellow Enzyme family)/thioredoxin reductase
MMAQPMLRSVLMYWISFAVVALKALESFSMSHAIHISEHVGGLSHVFQPAAIRNLELPNRVLMAPMEKNLCTADGAMTQRYIEYLVARARGGVGLVRVEATYVDPVGKGRPFQCGAHADQILPQLRRMTQAVHEAGGRVSLELAHCGRQTNALISGSQPVAPSPVACELSGGFMPRELTVKEIGEIVERFAAAARRGKQGGLDAVEIHGASGYLLNAFMSPYTNLRQDDYGGSLENRMRFPLEVVAAVRDAIGDEMPLLYRMSGDDYVPNGLTVAETAPFAAALERAGVDLVDVSAGTYESITATQPPMEAAAGGLVELAAAIKAAVSIPISTAGKLGDLEVAEAALRAGKTDFVTIGRGLHADPELLHKTRTGRAGEIRRCIACAECVAFLGQDIPAYCAVNPATIREAEFAGAPATATTRTVVVVGAGPAGLEAARTTRLQGHDVVVYERSDSIGGQVRYGQLVDGRADFGEPVRYLARELERLGVPIRLGTEVDAELIGALGPDVLVVATGAHPTASAIPGADLPQVQDAFDLLADVSAGRAPLAVEEDRRAVVVGGSWTGCHVAGLLLELGWTITIVEGRDSLGYDMGDQQGMVLRQRVLEHPQAQVLLRTTVERITPRDVVVWDSATNTTSLVGAARVVLVTRLEPERGLADAFVGRPSMETHVVGDAAQPRKLSDALLEGARAGLAL